MTDTFTFTHHALDKNKQPLVRSRVTPVLSSTPNTLRDTAAKESYSPPPKVVFNDDGDLCVADADGNPADTPGVELVVGARYRYRSSPTSVFDEVRFTAPDAGTPLDYSEIESEPVTLPPTWADEIAALRAEFASGFDPRYPEGTVLPLRSEWQPEWVEFIQRDPVTGAVIDEWDEESLPA